MPKYDLGKCLIHTIALIYIYYNNTYVLIEKSAISMGKIIGVKQRIVHLNKRKERRYLNIFDSAAAASSKAKNYIFIKIVNIKATILNNVW